MRVALTVLLICTVSLLAAPRRGIAEPPTAAEQALVVGAGNHFALDVYAQLDRAQPGENLFFSPASISVALAMTAAGARGPTAAEMAQVLRLDNQLAQAHAYYHELLKQWNAVDPKRPYQLRVANRLWGQRDYSLRPEFLALTRQEYDAAMQLLDFAQADSARREINQWVEKQTNDKIKDLVPAGAIDGTTRLVLTNAIYFKGDWLRPFAKDATRDQDFSVSAQRKVKVPLMRQTAVFGYGEEDSLQVLSMPYAGKDLSMVVLLPREADGLAELEKSLSLERLQSLLSKLRSREVATYIPRFKLECSFGLEPTLEALGMKRAFSPEADFTGISAHRGLYISAVLHKAFVDVNEEGTEAAAATGVFMTKSRVARPPQTPPVFRADHPFLFLICDTQSGAVLFMGRVANPGR